MSVKLPNGIISRSMPEQVGKNMRDIEELKTGYNQISNIAIVNGHLIVTLQDGTEYDTGAIKGIDTIAFNDSKHLIVTYDDGTTADLGLLKGVSNMSINASQHLIVTYDNGSTEDLGSIFTGNVNIAGNLTADSIIENMTGYSFSKTTDGSITMTYSYAGVVKNGNKITFAIAGTVKKLFNATSNNIGTFSLPNSVLAALIGVTFDGFTDVLSITNAKCFENLSTAVDVPVLVRKGSGVLFTRASFANLTADVVYDFRFEITLLLSANLAA